jgi:hypothetical protein
MSSTASFCPIQPPTKYIKQPEVLLAACFSLSELRQATKPACLLQPILAYNMLRSTWRQHNMKTTVITSMDKGESTNPYTVTRSLLVFGNADRLCGQLSLPSKTAPVSHSSGYNGQRMKPTREEGHRYKLPGPSDPEEGPEPHYVAYASAFLGSRYHY